MEKLQFSAPCLLGLEGLAAEELRMLEAENVQAENGRVLFSGDETMLVRANLCSRYAERIQILLGAFEAHSFEELFQGVKSLPWENFIGVSDAFPVKGWAINSDLHSIPDCQAIIKKAVVKRLESCYHQSWFDETGPVHQIQFSVMKNMVSVMLDTSGVGLHKRGYRPQSNQAPIKETLAAAMANLSRLRHYHTMYDPFCGSGTVLIEAAMMAHNIAPGRNRHFAVERWGIVPERLWKEEIARAHSLEKTETDFVAYGSDIEEDSLQLTRWNAEKAGVADKLVLSQKDIRDFAPETERGTLICNPPYGERMLEIREAEELYRIMGRKFLPQKGWSYSIISPHEQFEALFGRKADKRRKLYNGMIKCQLYTYFK